MRAILAERAAEPARRPPARPPTGRWPSPSRSAACGWRTGSCSRPWPGIANWAYRRQSRRHGAGLAISEMIASFGIRYANRKTLGMLTIAPDEHPVGVQVFGADRDAMVEAARAVEAAGADLIDINMGCPVPEDLQDRRGRRAAGRPRGRRAGSWRRWSARWTCPSRSRCAAG